MSTHDHQPRAILKRRACPKPATSFWMQGHNLLKEKLSTDRAELGKKMKKIKKITNNLERKCKVIIRIKVVFYDEKNIYYNYTQDVFYCQKTKTLSPIQNYTELRWFVDNEFNEPCSFFESEKHYITFQLEIFEASYSQRTL